MRAALGTLTLGRRPSPLGAQDIRTPAKHRVAVLYLENLAGEKDDEYFTAGMTEDIITDLSKIKELEVASRHDVEPYRGRRLNLPQVGRELGVTHLLEGSIRKAGNRLRITAQLIDTATGFHVWAERYDRELEDVFALQAEIAETIAQALKVTLTSGERAAIQQRPTENLKAYDYYLRGREAIYTWSHARLEEAIGWFEKAIALDPSFAHAHAGLADALNWCSTFFTPKEEDEQRALRAAERALALNDQLSEAHAAYGFSLFNQARAEEGIDACVRAVEIDPANVAAHWILGRLYFMNDRLEEAIPHTRTVTQLKPDFFTPYGELDMMYRRLGKHDQAMRYRELANLACRRHLEAHPNDARAHNWLASGLASEGKRDEAMAEAKKAFELSPDDTIVLYNLACVYALLGENRLAIEFLSSAFDHGWRQFAWAEQDPDLEGIRKDPRYGELLRRVDLEP